MVQVQRKKININKVVKTVAGDPVRALSFKTYQNKKSLQFIDHIQGQVLWYDDLIKAKVWISETWSIDGTHEDINFNLVECVKSDGLENQLYLF